jgi:(2R)-ethylmalonyl-CoA mutase
MRARGLKATPVVVGGIIPAEDVSALRTMGVAAVYTPKDADLNRIIGELVDVVRAAQGLSSFGLLA